MRLLLAIILGALAFLWFREPAEIIHPPGILVKEAPQQTSLRGEEGWEYKGRTITPMAKFRVRARVLSKAYYFLDRRSDVSSYDLALGWEDMSDSAILDEIRVTQSNRWYYLKWRKALPLGENNIFLTSANMHIIAPTWGVQRQLQRITKGNIVVIEGFLVRVEGKDDVPAWISSMSRADRNNNSCEVIWATSITIER